MQAIIDSLPEFVRNYKDYRGKTIIDYEFAPFESNYHNSIKDMKECDFLTIIRPHYIMEEIECQGKKLLVIKEKIEGNIQEAIDNKIQNIYISSNTLTYVNSFEDDVYRLLDAGHIKCMIIGEELKSNGEQYHVDFINNGIIGDNITSYYNYGRETAKTVVLKSPVGPITNDLITLGVKNYPSVPYSDTITSKFIGNTKYTNVRNHLKNQDILYMLEALKAKIEAL